MMNFDPVFFDNTMYETANDAVLFCREYLKKDNEHVVRELARIDTVTGAPMAQFALDLFLRAQPRVRGREAQEYVRIAISTLDRALAGECAPRSAA